MWPFDTGHLPDEIRLLEDGFKLLDKGRLRTNIAWTEITGIAAFKRDVFIGTQISLALRVAGRPEYILVTQDMAGWCVLLEALDHHFTFNDPEWLWRVSEPVWGSPWTVVWGAAPLPEDL